MRLTRLALTRPVSTLMASVAVVLFGVLAFQRLPLMLLPDLTYPTLTIRTRLPEAAPAEVETLLSKPIEAIVGVVDNVTRVSSTSRAGVSEVVLEFAWGTRLDLATLEVRERLERLQLPREAEAPLLLRYDPDLDPIVRLSLAGSADLPTLRHLADGTVKRAFEVLEGVAAVQVLGGYEAEMQVEVNADRLTQLGLALPQVVERLRQDNVDLAGGIIQDGEARYLVRTINALATVDDLGSLIVAQRHGAPILLRDVATVRHGHKDRQVITRINGEEAIELAIVKRVDANTVRVAELVRRTLSRVNGQLRHQRQGAQVQVVSDQSIFIRQSIREVLHTAVVGGALAMLVLYMFLRDLRSTLIIGSTIPLSVLGSFFLMYLWRVSLNIMSLGGLALGIGMLVDNAIVVLESINRQRLSGLSRPRAALRGAAEVGQAITASTLTTLCVFVPLLFVQGVAGQLFHHLAMTVSFALLTSLALALTLIPMLSALGGEAPTPSQEATPQRVAGRLAAWGRGIRPMMRLLALPVRPFKRACGWLLTGFEHLVAGLMAAYLAVLDSSLRRRMPVVLVVGMSCAGAAYLGGFLEREFIPEFYQGELIADITLATGTPLETTDRTVHHLEHLVRQLPPVVRVYSSIGRRQQSGAAVNEERQNVAQMRLFLAPELRPDEEDTLLATLRRTFQQVPGVQAQFGRPTYFSFAMPLEVEIRGHELDALRQAARLTLERMQPMPGLTDLRSSMAPGEPELVMTFDRQKLAALGLQLAEVAALVKQHVQGEVATVLQRSERYIDVRVRAQPALLQGITAVERLRINPQAPVPVPLSAVATLTVSRGPMAIRHENLQRVAVIAANVEGRGLGDTMRGLHRRLAGLPLPPGFDLRVRGQSTDMVAAFRSLFFALVLATFLVYLVLAAQFESFVQPWLILCAMPLGCSGVVLALGLAGQPLNVMVGIGAILLVGIVVNNAIVLIDYGNQCQNRGLTRQQAIREAAAVRFRPIVMTTATTVLGLLPLALGTGQGAELRAPLAITVIGGLLVATFLTLLVIPVAYSLVGGGRRRLVADDVALSADLE